MALFKTSFIRKVTLFLISIIFSLSALAALDFSQNQKLANQGNASAQYNLGVMYYKGDGILQDHSKAIEWFQKAANQGHTNAQYNLEAMQSNNEGGYQENIEFQRISEPVPVFVRSSNANLTSITPYPSAYESVLIAEADIQLAQAEAGIELATSINSGIKPENLLETRAKRGDANAQYILGLEYFGGFGRVKDYRKALEWYQKSANQGHIKAQHELGGMYYYGNGTTKNAKKAVEWWEKAANQGNVDAQYNLGIAYQKGYGNYGSGKDYKKAITWYQKAANQGDAGAQNNLGYMYSMGLGIRQNHKKAFEWYQKSSNQGNIDGRNNVGRMYLKGNGVRQNKAPGRKNQTEFLICDIENY